MALNLKKKFAADTDRLVSGARLNLGDGAYLMVARWGNKEHQAALDQLRSPHKEKLELGATLNDDEAEEIAVKSIAKAILVGWGGLAGIVDPNDESETPYSIEAAEALLRDKEMEEIRATVVQFSMRAANYRKAALASTEKNSAPSSAGGKNTGKTRASS